MKCLVTGAGGFIGSHLCEALLAKAHTVVGLDAFVPYYPRAIREKNLQPALALPQFTFLEQDLRTADLSKALEGVEVVFHLAAMAGLAKSWTEFSLYQNCNLEATQRLLEAVRRQGQVQKFLYASTSSVYGKFGSGDETLPTRPTSPYGVTKLAGENLCRAYGEEFGLPIVALRYFSVYGPRQRPDMGYWKFIDAILRGQPIVVFGDGLQVRGNTYVGDCVSATLAAMRAISGEVFNVGGGETANVWDILRLIEEITGKKAEVKTDKGRPGDQRYTFADTSKLRRHLGWEPQTGLREGLSRQIDWQKSLLS